MKTFFYHTLKVTHILAWMLVACIASANTTSSINLLPDETKTDKNNTTSNTAGEENLKSENVSGDSMVTEGSFSLRIETENDKSLEIEIWMVDEIFWTGNK